MEHPKVSVLIPAYNHEKYVGEAIHSVLDQTFQDLELIIINDGSTDHTQFEILKFKDERIRYFSQENRGLSPTLNRGIQLARGEYFNFLPSDDAFLPEKLEAQLKAFEEGENTGLVFSYHLVVDSEGKEVKDDPIVDWFTAPYGTKEEIFPVLFERDFLSAPTALIKMECFKKVGLFDESLKTAQDYDLWMRILKYYDLQLIKRPLLKLRWHGANLTFRATPVTELERTKVLLKAYRDLNIEDIFPSLRQKQEAFAYAEAYEKLATHAEKSGLPTLLPISQIYRNRGKRLIEKKEELFLFERRDREEGERGYDQGGFGGTSKKIHLLIETRSLDKGGLEEVIYGIATHLDPDLFSPVVVCIEAGGFTADRIRKAGIPVEVLGEKKEREYIEILNRYRIDVINTHYSFFGSAIAYRMGIPVISVLHSTYSWYSGNVLEEFRKFDPCISRYIAVSEKVSSFSKYRFNIDPKRIRVIPDGIDISRFEGKERPELSIRETLGLHEDDFIFLHVGAINPAKMHNLLVAAMRELARNDPKVRLLCMGQVLNEEYYHFIQKKIEEYHLEPTMKLLGFVENPGAYYQSADAFVMPSLIEGWGIATVEAMYHGLPLILTRVGGAEELIENGDIGILIDNCCPEVDRLTASDWDAYSRLDVPSNTPQLIEAMLEIYRNRNKWKTKSKKGKQKVLSRYTWDKIIPEYEKEFIGLALENRGKGEIRLIRAIRDQRMRLDEQERQLGGHIGEREVQRKLIENQTVVIQNQAELIRDQQIRLEEQKTNDAREIAKKDENINALSQQLIQKTAEKDAIWDQLSQTRAEKDHLWNRLNQRIAEKDAIWNQLTQTRAEKDHLWNRLNQTIVEKDNLWNQLNQTIADKDNLWNQLNQRTAEKNTLFEQLDRIYTSDFWKIASSYYKFRAKIPLAKYVHKFLQVWRKEGLKKVFKKSIKPLTRETKDDGHKRDENHASQSDFNPYDQIKLLKSINVSPIDQNFDLNTISTAFSFITTIRNESSNIIDFLGSIEEQTLKPDEIIIVDGGSTDNTIELAENYVGHSALLIRLIKGSHLNIAQGRNRGIREAKNELIVLSDAGCKLDKNFCKNLVGCFGPFKDADLVGGIYHPLVTSEFAKYFVYDWRGLNWDDFLPSARSLALKKSLVLQMGGFPEYLTLTGEDTLFDINYRKVSSQWVFNKKSIIYWNTPKTENEVYKVAFNYGKGDGESGIGDFRFHKMFYEQLKHYRYSNKTDIHNPVERGLFLGYVEGRKNRANIEIDKRNIKGVILFLSEAPFAQPETNSVRTALELIAKGYKVAFVNVNPPSSPDQQIWCDTDFTLLELYSARDFDWEEFIERYKRIPERTFVLYPAYQPVLSSIIEKLKAKTGNKIKVISGSHELGEDHSGRVASEVKISPCSVSELQGGISQLPTTRDNHSIFGPFYHFTRKLKSSVANNRLMFNLLKFRDYSRNDGVREALRKSFRKLKKLILGDQRGVPRNITPPSSSIPGHTPFQTINECSFDIISFPIMPWFSRFQRSQQLLTRFAADGTRIFRMNRSFLLDHGDDYALEKVQDHILHITLPSSRDLSIYTDPIDTESLSRMLKSIDRLRIEHMISNAICIVELPFWYPLAKELKERYDWKIVYDCMDEHMGFSTNEGQMLSKESRLGMDSSLVVVTSQYLHDKMVKVNKNCVRVPNATDFQHFSRLPENNLLKSVGKPIIGYYGALSEWFDIEMIEWAAKARKDWQFIFIGGNDSGVDMSALERLPNVRFLGEKSYAEIPEYLYWFDVCIIPFKLSKLTEATDPVKFYEYISSGKPVVSVRLPELFPVADYLYLANDKEDFVRKIEAALEEKDEGIRQRRIEFAKGNTWEKRYEALKTAMDNLYPKVSIIMVTYNNLSFTKACLDSIYSKSQYPNFELIIVDNHSEDGTEKYLAEISTKYRNIKLIINHENKGFAPANNQGIKAATGQYIILLNNDTVVTPGWITRLLRYLQNKDIGMVGPVTNMCGNEAIIYVPYDVVTLEGFEDFLKDYYRTHTKQNFFEIDMLSMYCVALRRETIEEVGLLDERFKVGTFEDTDYAQRLKAKGYKLICARDVFVHHYCRTSFGKLPNEKYLKIYAENRRKFEEKWGMPSRY